ncbi:MAG: type II toxin-antitoxin system RelE/ParE family toxin [Firmicutes bacterium]|nr:type II toxin-antitoxin system RelE/ParE family toxin [Bacillota bacterium]
MTIHDYYTDGGKNLIKTFLSDLPVAESTCGYGIRHKIIKDGLKAFDGLDTRQLYGKLWEIKFADNRIMYVIFDKDNVYFLHACKKQKGKAEQFELNKAISRAKEQNLL